MIHINLKEKCLVNSETGEILRPDCWDHLHQYHAFLKSRNHHAAAKTLLEDVFAGQRVISKMIANFQKHEAKGDFNKG